MMFICLEGSVPVFVSQESPPPEGVDATLAGSDVSLFDTRMIRHRSIGLTHMRFAGFNTC